MPVLLIGALALALAGAGTASERVFGGGAKAPAAQPKKGAKAPVPTKGLPASSPELYSAPVVAGRPYDPSAAETKAPRDGMLALNPNDPYTAWPSSRPGNPPRPRRREGGIHRTREELVNNREPELGYSEITGIRDPGRFDVTQRVHIGHSDMWDADGNLYNANGIVDERPSPYEAVWQSRVPATETLGVLNQQRQRAERESGRCVENMYAPTPARLFAAEPLGVVGTGGVPTSTKKLDEMVTLTPGLTSIIKMDFMAEGHGGNDRMPGKSREFKSERLPTKRAVFGNLGFVNPQFIVAERVGKLREVEARVPEVGNVPVGPVPNTMDAAIGDRMNKKDTLGAFDIGQSGQSHKVQEPNNFTRGGFHAGNREAKNERDNGKNIPTVIKGATEVERLEHRAAPMREGISASRVSAPSVLPPNQTAWKRAQALASKTNGNFGKSKHEF